MKSSLSLIPKILRARGDFFQVLTLLELRNGLGHSQSILDVGCGECTPLSLLGLDKLSGIEGFAASYEKAKQSGNYHELVLGDIRNLTAHFQPKQFDACVAIDVIEHLTKQEGLKLMRDMESIAKRKVVLFTPNGFLPQSHAESTDLQEHLSGWDPEEMNGLGYNVKGMLGPKWLRGDHHALKRRPKWFWGVVCLVCHLTFTQFRPKNAAALLCVKNLDSREAKSSNPSQA